MTKGREEAKKEIEEIITDINREEKIKKLEERIINQEEDREKLRKENLKLKKETEKNQKWRERKEDFSEKWSDIKKSLSDKWEDSDLRSHIQIYFPIYLAILGIAGAIGGAGYGIYTWNNSIKEDRKRIFAETIKKDQQETIKMFGSFANTLNQKDQEALKEHIICENGNSNYNFLEVVVNKVMTEGFFIKELKINENIPDKYIEWAISEGYNPIGGIRKVRLYNIKIEANLISNQQETKKLEGLTQVGCRTRCAFQVTRRRALFEKDVACPDYSRKD